MIAPLASPYIEGLYADYVGTEEYRDIPATAYAADCMKEARSMLEVGNTADVCDQAFVGGEENGFVLGFKYAVRLFAESGVQPECAKPQVSARSALLEIDAELSKMELSTERARAALQEVTQNFFGVLNIHELVKQTPALWMVFDKAAPFSWIVEDYLVKIAETLKHIRRHGAGGGGSDE